MDLQNYLLYGLKFVDVTCLLKVRRDEMYEMVYTSQTGLYRYRTGDIVKIVDFFRQTPVYEFQYRSLP